MRVHELLAAGKAYIADCQRQNAINTPAAAGGGEEVTAVDDVKAGPHAATSVVATAVCVGLGGATTTAAAIETATVVQIAH